MQTNINTHSHKHTLTQSLTHTKTRTHAHKNKHKSIKNTNKITKNAYPMNKTKIYAYTQPKSHK